MPLNEQALYFWLGLSGITSRRANILLDNFSVFELWDCVGSEITQKSLFGDKAYEALLRFKNEDFITESMARLDDMGISFVTFDRFPEKLKQKEVSPPTMLYYRGDVKLLDTDSVAIVGTRACSSYGREVATKLSEELCREGVTVVSGLATGIDMYAHRAAVKAGGKTVAVLGSGLNCIAPQSNLALADDIIESGGLIVSEYAPRTVATKYTFPERNRIISALSLGVVVVEAGLKSGALITADYALEQNRTVFAVPGNITSIKSVGANKLLYEGAVPAIGASEICETLGIGSGKIDKKPHAIQLDIFEQKIYNILLSGEESFDSLVIKAELPAPKLFAVLSQLEIEGIVNKKQSNIYCLAQ